MLITFWVGNPYKLKPLFVTVAGVNGGSSGTLKSLDSEINLFEGHDCGTQMFLSNPPFFYRFWFLFHLGGGSKYFLFSPPFREDSQFDYYFSNGLKPPTSHVWQTWFWEVMSPSRISTFSRLLHSCLLNVTAANASPCHKYPASTVQMDPQQFPFWVSAWFFLEV